MISSGQVSVLAGPTGFIGPFGIGTDGTNLYVADYNASKIVKVVISSGQASVLAGPTGFTGPHGITTDGTYLYVGGYTGHNILKIE